MKYEIPLAGVYQKENAVVALNALKVLDELGFPTAGAEKYGSFAQRQLGTDRFDSISVKNRCLW
ncbi:MAG: hypothetical protein ACLUTA_05100 [Blautia wexlerae]